MINPNQLGRSPFPAGASQWMLVGLRGGGPVADVIVDTWHDSSGSGNHAVQATVGNRPIRKANIVNGMPAVLFDGVNDYLTLTTELNLADCFLFVVYQTTGDDCLIGAATANWQILRIGESGSNVYSYSDPGLGSSIQSTTLAASRSAWNIGVVIRSASNAVGWNEAGTSRGSVTGSASAAKIGCIGTLQIAPLAIPTNGYIAEVVLYNVALTGSDAFNIIAGLGSKYGITVAGGGTPVLPNTVTGLIGWWKADAL